MDKRNRLREIAEEIMEMYPHIDGVIVEGSLDEPSRIVFMSQDDMSKLAEELEMDVEDLNEEYEDSEQELLEFFGFDDDDDKGNGGMLQ